MKKLLFLLFLPLLAVAQNRMIEITPTVNTTILYASTVNGSKTVTAWYPATIVFDTVTLVHGSTSIVIHDKTPTSVARRILLGATVTGTQVGSSRTVVNVTNDSTVIMSDTATTSGTLDTVTITNSAAGEFASILAGQRITGVGIPFLSSVASKTDSANIVLSAAATATADSVKIRVGYYTSLAYTTGDAIGMPFYVGQWKTIKQIIVQNDSVGMTSVGIVFFDSAFVDTADNSALAFSDASSKRIVGYAVVGGTGAYTSSAGNVEMVFPPTTLPLNFASDRLHLTLYGQMVALAGVNFRDCNAVRIKFIGE